MDRIVGPPDPRERVIDQVHMARAVELAAEVRGTTAPNPWVGCVVVPAPVAGRRPSTYEGATAPAGGPHAEVRALGAAAADGAAAGATLYTTLEPCAHTGRTGPCADAVIDSGIARVVIGVVDPDPLVSGRGVARLREAGLGVQVGLMADEITEQLAPYLKHRRTGTPWVVLKLAATLDGRTAAPDGSSRWITGDEARADAHRLRATSDAVLVGAGTVRSDDPQLTVRVEPVPERQPLRVVLGEAPPGARVQPALELSGSPSEILADLGGRGVLQLLVEGGARVAHEFHRAGLVDRYVLYVAPALAGGNDARPLFDGPGAPTITDFFRGRFVSVRQLGEDLRVEVAA
jgi:diaminohydroxyphosphoribosylaminopyrimidine deaminase/5-amino-6-(5-phosphoribosylamino)uracil reductase